jgi:hypothetical protein
MEDEHNDVEEEDKKISIWKRIKDNVRRKQ